MQLETCLAQAGGRSDPRTGSITAPIYQTATFSHPALGAEPPQILGVVDAAMQIVAFEVIREVD